MNKNLYIGVIVFLLGIVAGGLLFNRCSTPEKEILTQRDTLVIKDTISIEKPTEIRYQKITETIPVPVQDTVVVHDTLFVLLTKEVREYKDSMYYAVVSGYEPHLDFIEIYPETKVIKEVKTEMITKQNRLSLGLEAGMFTSPYAPIYLEYERMLHKNVDIYARIMYDVVSMNRGVSIGAKFQVGW